MATFTLLVELREFDLDPRSGVSVTLEMSPKRYPVAGVGFIEATATVLTNADGIARFEGLLSLPGLRYIITAGDGSPISISGEGREEGSVVRADSQVSLAPSPIQPVDAAALRAEVMLALANVEAGLVSWDTVADKPLTFPPADHAHAQYALVTDLADKVATTDKRLTDAREPLAHGHDVADITGLQAVLDGLDIAVAWADITDKPATFPPASHDHAQYALATDLDAKVDDDDARLSDARAPLDHDHAIADVTDLQAALDAAGRSADLEPQAGTSYVAAQDDAGKLITLTNAAAITVTLPASLAVGTRIDFAVLGAGMATFVGSGGATIVATPSAVTRATGSAASATKLTTTAWLVVGDLA